MFVHVSVRWEKLLLYNCVNLVDPPMLEREEYRDAASLYEGMFAGIVLSILRLFHFSQKFRIKICRPWFALGIILSQAFNVSYFLYKKPH